MKVKSLGTFSCTIGNMLGLEKDKSFTERLLAPFYYHLEIPEEEELLCKIDNITIRLYSKKKSQTARTV